jgi:hypothetical protein
LRGRTAGSGSTGEVMRADGTPIQVTTGVSKSLQRERIGGSEGQHDEQWLQQLIHRHPITIPIGQIESGFSDLVPVCMELPLRSGYLDNLLMTRDGNIVIVEVKLFRNPQARREVLAQALDYASALFRMNYTDLEAAILKADFDGGLPPKRLYDLFDGPGTPDEPAFVDAVNSNLKNGRFVVLVVGDGIRTDAESLMDSLQSHAGFHFTFALVELSVYQGASPDDLIVVPSTLAKTVMIERGIVRIDDKRGEVVPVKVEPKAKSNSKVDEISITSEQFYESMRDRRADLPGVLKVFVNALADVDVYTMFNKSLNLMWDSPTGESVNLGFVEKTGTFYTNRSGNSKVAQAYIEDLAKAFGGTTKIYEKGNGLVLVDGKSPPIESLLDKQEDWMNAIIRLQTRIREDEGE